MDFYRTWCVGFEYIIVRLWHDHRHHSPKLTYYNMGSNSGQLSADVANFKRLREIVGAMPACTDDEMKVGKLVATAKPEVILAIATKTNLHRFCETE